MVKYSEDLVKEICKYVLAGNTHKDSAILSGISEDTFYEWRKAHTEFSEALKKAEQQCKSRNIAIIQRAGEKSWQASAWYLERRYHDEFALKTVMEHSTDPDKPLTIKIVADNGYRAPNTELPQTTSDIRPSE